MIRQILCVANEIFSISESLNECLDQLESHLNEERILGAIFFIDSQSDADYFKLKREIHQSMEFRMLLMPFNVLAQSSKSMASIEIWTDDSAIKTEYLSLKDTRYTRVTSEFGKSVWGFGITSNMEELQISGQIEFAFDTTLQILEKEGMALSDIVRQWNYIPDILDIRTIDTKNQQHYQIFNDIRQKYYSTAIFNNGYPAATGIGTKNGNFDLDFFAIKNNPSIQVVGLSNPKQQDAYKYDHTLLLGDAPAGQSKKTPMFERAKILKTNEGSMIFISGTASIIGQDTIGIGDIKYQTEITINNMLELIPKMDNLQTNQYTYIRAYIKEEHYFQTVRALCETHFPDVPILYLQADVCRENLLVEMEGAVIL